MNACLLLSLALLGAEPPDWFSVVRLEQPLLPQTVTDLNATDEFLEPALDLANTAQLQRASDEHPKAVHQRYRRVLFGEHIVITPNRDKQPVDIGDKSPSVVSLVIGFERPSHGTDCKLTGLMLVDGRGIVHEFSEIPASEQSVFEKFLQNWLQRRIAGVKAARARNARE